MFVLTRANKQRLHSVLPLTRVTLQDNERGGAYQHGKDMSMKIYVRQTRFLLICGES